MGRGEFPANAHGVAQFAADHADIGGTPYSYDARLNNDLVQVQERVDGLRAAGQLTPEVLERIRRYFRIKNIYHSNAIEGNMLTVGETRLVVEVGLTLTGKPLRDQAEAKNLSHALDFLEQLAIRRNDQLTERDIREIHQLVLQGISDEDAGRYRDVSVEISGSEYKPPRPESVGPQMAEFGEWLAQSSIDPRIHPLLLAGVAHTWLVTIHPFVDGNGRVARLLMNLILMRAGYPIAVITKEDRQRYYDALEESQSGDLTPFVVLMKESFEESLEEYEAAVLEHREHEEWARSIAERFTEPQRVRAENEYEVWKSAMDLLKGYFRQTAQDLDEMAGFGSRVFFKDFGTLEFEKYASLRERQSTKRTWFFRIDFRRGDEAARYLVFFGYPSHILEAQSDVTAFVAREERPFSFERLDNLSAPNVPTLREIGYWAGDEIFLARYAGDRIKRGKVEEFGRQFIEEVMQMHFA